MKNPSIAWSDIEQICEGSFQRIGLDYKHMWSKIRKNPSVQHLIPAFGRILLEHLPSKHMEHFKIKLEKFVLIIGDFLTNEGTELTPFLYNKVLVACQLENARG